MANQGLFPTFPVRKGYHLSVSPRHSIWVEEAGNPDGIPALILQGGPGGVIQPDHRRLFDPAIFRTVSFDQRGSGRSVPLGELAENRLDDLAGDVERLRKNLGVDRWVILGHSFGGAIGLRFAQLWSEACRYLILVAPVTAPSGFETHDFVNGPEFAPAAWSKLFELMPSEPCVDMAAVCFSEILAEGEKSEAMRIAWYEIAEALARNGAMAAGLTQAPMSPEQIRAAGRLSAHYWMNRLFQPQGRLLENCSSLERVKGSILHGSKDFLVPVSGSVELCRRWRSARLEIVDKAGHDLLQREMIAPLQGALRRSLRVGAAE